MYEKLPFENANALTNNIQRIGQLIDVSQAQCEALCTATPACGLYEYLPRQDIRACAIYEYSVLPFFTNDNDNIAFLYKKVYITIG